MAAVGLLHHVDRQETNRVDAALIDFGPAGARRRPYITDVHRAARERSLTLPAIRSNSWCQDLLNASAPSRCNCRASFVSSTPASRHSASNAAESPPSTGNTCFTSP